MPESPWWTTLEPAPAGFTSTTLHKRVLLQGSVVVLVHSLQELQQALPGYAQRLVGLVLTPAAQCTLTPLSSHLWHVQLPLPVQDTARTLLQGWLHSIVHTDRAEQAAASAQTRTERATRDLSSVQTDYQSLTQRLLQQLDALTQAQQALSDANEALEQRVQARTQALEAVNRHLNMAVQELQRTQGELVRQEKLAGLGAMVAGIAHELNTPIGNALTVSSTMSYQALELERSVREGRLKRSDLDRFTNECVDMSAIMERNLKAAAEIIQHFKQLAVDQTSECRRTFTLRAVVADTLYALQPRLRKSSVSLELDIPATLELDSYPGAISQILNNLILNALTHAFDSGAPGRMWLQAIPSGDLRSVHLEFGDDGAGIAPPDLPRVFDPFFTTRMGQGGSGLGLHLVYNLTTAMLGGTITIDSTLGEGTRVRIEIPTQAPDRATP